MGRRPKYTATEIRTALEEQGGIVEAVAESLSVTPKTIYNNVNRYGLWQHVTTGRDELVSLARAGLKKHLQQDDPPAWAIKYTLSRFDGDQSGGGMKMQLYATVSPDDWDDDGDE